MNEEIRRVVAYAAMGRVNLKFSSSVYSYATGHHTYMSENYDYRAKAHLSGIRTNNIYHYGVSAYINLRVTGNNFTGYDYSSRSHFSGHVSGHSVEVYDYGNGRYFFYSL